MTLISLDELQKYLSEILACDAFELHTDSENAYIPYMMNDALECYLHFSGIQLTGHYLPDFEGETTFELISSETRPGIIFRQGTENLFTLWFSSCCRALACYRYDQIGHFWVEGQEHWRRLVYIVGTIWDKYEYMGGQVCTEAEQKLLPLMEFAPFRMYSPIHGFEAPMESAGSAASAVAALLDFPRGPRTPRRSLDPLAAIYPDSRRGLETMTALAREADDRFFLFLLYLYRRLPFSWMKKTLHRAMNRPGRIPLYELLFQKIQDAASVYPARDYGPARNERICRMRSEVSRRMQEQGFSGQYPLFQKGRFQILAMEEHPFTILEASDFDFRIQLMESETAVEDFRTNAGFFQKKNNRSRISQFSD